MYPIHLNNYFSTLPFDILLASSLLITVLARVQILFINKRLLKGSMSFELLIKKMKRLVAYLAKAYPGFPSINWWGVSLTPPPLLDGMPVYSKVTLQHSSGFPDNSLVPICTPGWRETLWSSIYYHDPWPSQVSNPQSSTLTLRLQLLQQMLISNMLKEMLGNR